MSEFEKQPRFWAKTGKGDFENGQPQYHPVICHLADTAAVAMEIVRSHLSPIARQRLCEGLGLSEDSAIRFCGFMAGCHDLGKVSPAFQFQVSEVGSKLVGQSVYDLWVKYTNGEFIPHGTITATTLPEFLEGEWDIDWDLAQKLAAIVGGHHGFFPGDGDFETLEDAKDDVGREKVWRPFREEVFQQLLGFVKVVPDDIPDDCDNAAAMLLAGLTTVADWIASNETDFPYRSDIPFTEYTKGLRPKAKVALKKQGWTGPPPSEPLSFKELFDFVKETRPLQDEAIALTESHDLLPPCLVMVEASMGEGKTEVALFLADYFQHHSFGEQASAGGFYIGLPTQATSNAMYKRVQKFLRKRYSNNDEIVNFTLSHSAASLSKEYQDTVCRLEQVYDDDGNKIGGGIKEKVVTSKWHTARRRSLLSSYGVGTIDQGLMGVVRSRWQFVRLFGLAGRTVILDEIHAYDLYTSTLLERFLEWLALLGSPVIALSATLPKDTRQRLLNAYAKGAAKGAAKETGKSEPKLEAVEYPRITTFANGTLLPSRHFDASPHVHRQLRIHWVEEKTWIEELLDALEQGGCVAVICSTVDRAQGVYEHLKSSGHFHPDDELGLFHGRFLFKQRQEIEKACLNKFDREGKRPDKYVLVATQVIEQSLDLDFDLMVTDLAPIDLLLQRSGRLHRHDGRARSPKLEKPELWLIKPTFDDEGNAKFAESAYIYHRHVLLRSWLALRDRTRQNTIELPKEMDTLIEAVYDLDMIIPPEIEPIHQKDWEDTKADYLSGETAEKKAKANNVMIPPANGENDPHAFTQKPTSTDDEAEVFAATRLGEKTVTVVFVQQTDDGLILPLSGESIDLKKDPNRDMAQVLLDHSTRISKRGLTGKLLTDDKYRCKRWNSSNLLRHCRYVTLKGDRTAEVGKWEFYLDPDRGVVISADYQY